MKQYLGLGLAMLAGTVIGAAAVGGLHAQSKPPVYLVTEINVTNPEAYGTEFAPKAQATIKAARALQPFDLTWLEEPIIPDDVAAHARILVSGGVPIAAGEN